MLIHMSEIVIKNVSKSYDEGESYSVKNLSLSIKKGTIFGFLGANGAGKTTTIKMLVGLTRPSEGEIFILGKSPENGEIKSHIGFMPESPSFYPHLTGKEFLSFVAGLFDLENKEERIKEVLHLVDLQNSENKKVKTYSKGMLQRLGVAQALLNDPDIIFLDEPLDGLDPLGRAEIKKIIISLKARKKTIFFNSHILGDMEEICDEVGIIDKGTLIVHGAPSKVRGQYSNLEEAFVAIIKEVRKE